MCGVFPHGSFKLIEQLSELSNEQRTSLCKLCLKAAEGWLAVQSMAKRTCLEEYHLAIQSFSDSLKGLNALTEEARVRCEKARRALLESRTAYEREKSQATPFHKLGTCQERDALEEQYGTVVIAFNDALKDTQLPPRIADGEKREKIDRARNVCHSVLKRLEDHEQEHKCRRAVSRSANAGPA